MDKKAVDIYQYSEAGYKPLLEFNGNNIAVLNYLEAARLKKLSSLEKHRESDEVFIPVSGEMQMITKNGGEFTLTPLTPGKVYIVKKNIYHGLIMEEGSSSFVIRRTHPEGKKDVTLLELSSRQIKDIKDKYRAALQTEVVLQHKDKEKGVGQNG